MTIQCVGSSEDLATASALPGGTTQMHGGYVLAHILEVHLSALAIASPAADATILIVPGVGVRMEVERLQVANDSRA